MTYTLLLVAFLIFGVIVVRTTITTRRLLSKRVSILERRKAIFDINPRNHRSLIKHTTTSQLKRTAWMLAQNNRYVTEGIKEYCELIGVDNSGTIDTLVLSEADFARLRRYIILSHNRIKDWLYKHYRMIVYHKRQEAKTVNDLIRDGLILFIFIHIISRIIKIIYNSKGEDAHVLKSKGSFHERSSFYYHSRQQQWY